MLNSLNGSEPTPPQGFQSRANHSPSPGFGLVRGTAFLETPPWTIESQLATHEAYDRDENCDCI
jgi:hypothetical protein